MTSKEINREIARVYEHVAAEQVELVASIFQVAHQLAIANEREAARHKLLLEPAAIALLEARSDERYRALLATQETDVTTSTARHQDRIAELNRQIAKLKDRGQRSGDKNDE